MDQVSWNKAQQQSRYLGRYQTALRFGIADLDIISGDDHVAS